MGFKVQEQEGVNQQPPLQIGSDGEKHFFQESYVCARENAFEPPIREFENACGAIAAGGGSGTNQQVYPYGILTVSVDGAFTTFSPELLGMSAKKYGALEIGNVKTDSFREALQTPKYHQLASDIFAGVKRCEETCEYFDVCGGGAPANKLFETGSFAVAETNFCEQHLKIPVRIVLNDLEVTLAGAGKALPAPKAGDKARRISPWE